MTLIRTVCHQTDHSWIFSRKRVNFLRIKRLTCLTMTNPSRRNNPTERGIRSYMGWNHIPDIDSGATTSEDNPLAGPKLHTPGKVSVNLPTDEWLCKKMSKLNLTLVQGYPTHALEASGLLKDQFVRPPKSQGKWYGFQANPKKDSDQTISSWHTGSSRLNSTYLRIARQAGIASSPPMSRLISQESLRKWERSAHESTVICNQAAGFNRCLLKIQ